MLKIFQLAICFYKGPNLEFTEKGKSLDLLI
jgi:hypothetical protein